MRMQASSLADYQHGNHEDDGYNDYLLKLNARVVAQLVGSTPVFTTDAEGLWEAYLSSFTDPAERQYHNCNCCRHFIQRFGHLVTIDEHGHTTPLMWNEGEAPARYQKAVAAMGRLVRKVKVTGVFLTSDKVWGTPKTGYWTHFNVTPPASAVYRGTLLTAGQVMAEKREDFKNVIRALQEFDEATLNTALALLDTDSLYRSEKVKGPAQWLYDLHIARDKAKNSTLKANLTWRMVATAPAGFCHPRSSMVGTLLEDIASGMDFNQVSKRFAAKMHPLQYQRPQAAPKAGNIAAAEKVIAQLQAAGALQRRIARLDEIEALWRPVEPKREGWDLKSGEGVFSHLTPKDTRRGGPTAASMSIPPVTMTWDKFQRTVLPTAEAIEFYTGTNENFTAFVTAVNPDAPPILQWDSEEKRNPVSWYVWNGGASPTRYGLKSNTFQKVAAVSLKPSMWGGANMTHQGEAVAFLLEGARETSQAGAALFPEILKSDFHGIRSTIEAYSRRAKMEGLEEGSACGVMLYKGQVWNARVRVTSKGQMVEYKLDRWD